MKRYVTFGMFLVVLLATPAIAQNGPGLAVSWVSNGDGTFATRCPPSAGPACSRGAWSNYWYPSGLWLPGDYNGDGKADVVHAVEGRDYVHTWLSTGSAFNFTTFRPWAGYAIPNGIWRTGDFNGDGKTDIFHGVQNSDTAVVWLSNGFGGFVVSTFRPWPGYGIPNGLWLPIDVNGDRRTDMVHAVQNSDYVHVWLSQGNGTFNVTTFRPWAGYGIPNGEWLTGDFNNDGKGDLLHAVNGADYAHVWTSLGNGAFSVGTFRPWAGYAVINGLLRAGDFNADGRTDVLHAVTGGYVHVWFSQGNGSFSVTTFQPWAGYGIPNGEWQIADFNGDGRSDIVHSIQNSDYVHVWRSLGNGSFTVGTFRPWTGYSISAGQLKAFDFSGDGRADLLHVLSLSPARPLPVRRYTTASINDAQADTILTDATRVSFTKETSDDVVCSLRLLRPDGVGTFTTGDGSIDSSSEFSTVLGVPGFVKVVNQINWCGSLIPNVIGCAPVPGNSMVVVRYGAGTFNEGILWLHEYGHTRGLGHRTGTTTVMNPYISSTQVALSSTECTALR